MRRPKTRMRLSAISIHSLMDGVSQSQEEEIIIQFTRVEAGGEIWRNGGVFCVKKMHPFGLEWREWGPCWHVFISFWFRRSWIPLALAPGEFKICMLTWRIVTTGIQVWGARGSWLIDSLGFGKAATKTCDTTQGLDWMCVLCTTDLPCLVNYIGLEKV